MLVVPGIKSGEFKNNHSDFFFNPFTRLQKGFSEQVCIQKIRIDSATALREAGQGRKASNCDIVSCFQPKPEIRGNLRCEVFKRFLRWESVIGSIDADCLENLRIFCKAISIEA